MVTMDKFITKKKRKISDLASSNNTKDGDETKVPTAPHLHDFFGPSCSKSMTRVQHKYTDSGKTEHFDPYDIGRAVEGKKALSDEEKLKLLKETWKPPVNFSFPVQTEGKQNRKFRHEWLNQYKWLGYSEMFRGGFCTVCVLFASSGAGIGSQALRTLVKEPFVKYKKATEDLRHHENTNYHKFSIEKALEFTRSMAPESSQKSIALVLDTKTSLIIEQNRKRLRPIFKTIVLCARNNLPLRGHRDHGLVHELKEENTDELMTGKRGVFHSLLAFRMDAGDEDLKHHFSTCGRNSTMISNTVQNEAIQCIGEAIRSSISSDVKKAKFFSIMCDETTDVATKEQMTFCVRYIDTDTFLIKEDFLGFTELKSTTGASIAEAIDVELENLGLNYQYLCGQGYDGGSSMAGKFKGVQALILQKQPLAVYTHCFSHSLNLSISKSCDTPSVRNMMGVVGSVSVFLSASANRKNALERVISQLPFTESKKTKLKSMCPTRWVERHESLITFKELLVPIVTLLDELSSSRDVNAETASKACMYSSALRRGDFLVALGTTAYCFSITLRLSQQLQSPKMDLSLALNHVTDVIEVFKNLRRDTELEFGSIFEDSVKVAEDIGCELAMPRICSTQTKRENIPASNTEEYFRRVVFLPVVDHFIAQLEARFSQKFQTILPLEGLIPAHGCKYREDEIVQSSQNYEQFLENSALVLKTELKLWKKKWEDKNYKPETAVEALKNCDRYFFPNIFVLLQIFGTIPVTTSTPERTFSCLRRIKTYLRNTMGETRLNGLALANIHKAREINIENVIDIFSAKKKRRMAMENWTED